MISKKKPKIDGNNIVFEDRGVYRYDIEFIGESGTIALYKLNESSDFINDFVLCSETIDFKLTSYFNKLIDVVSDYYFETERNTGDGRAENELRSFNSLFFGDIPEPTLFMRNLQCEFPNMICFLNDFGALSLYDFERLLALNRFTVNYNKKPRIDYEKYEPAWATESYTTPLEYACLCYEDSKNFLQSNSDIFVHVTTYECSSICEILLAFLHYFKMNRYSMDYCVHCGKVLFTQSLKEKYCERKSPYVQQYWDNQSKDFSHLPCKEGVKNIKQKLARKRARIQSSIAQKYVGSATQECSSYSTPEMRLFQDDADQFLDKVKQASTIENLHEYEKFLFTYDYKKGADTE